MTVSVEDRIIKLEQDLNRVMQRLLDAAITEDAEQYRLLHEETMEDLKDRAKRLRELVSALESKHIIAQREKISE